MFVHARNATVKTASVLRDMAKNEGQSKHFAPQQTTQLGIAEKQVIKKERAFVCFFFLP